jgi:hypothetical protein
VKLTKLGLRLGLIDGDMDREIDGLKLGDLEGDDEGLIDGDVL